MSVFIYFILSFLRNPFIYLLLYLFTDVPICLFAYLLMWSLVVLSFFFLIYVCTYLLIYLFTYVVNSSSFFFLSLSDFSLFVLFSHSRVEGGMKEIKPRKKDILNDRTSVHDSKT